jgi:DNA-binding transcriptional regulator YhcF (GntR family)
VEARCCNWLLSTRDRVDGNILPLTHADLAEFLRVQRSTVSTTLRTFQSAGLITQQRGGIIIADCSSLEEIACECYGKIRQTFARLLPVPRSWA